jgi:transposase
MPSGVAVPLRDDFGADELRALAARSKDGPQARRLLALAAVAEGKRRTEAARIGGMDRQTLRDWVHRFNAEGPEGLINRTSPGAPSKLNDAQRAWLAEVVERGPDPAVDGVVRWRAKDLVALIWREFSISLSEDVVWKELRRLDFRYLSARPRHHAQDPQKLEDFKKISVSAWRRSGPGSNRARPWRSGSRTRCASGKRTS